jgi:hypothetical protein
MSTTNIRELAETDLDLVSGGMDPNYKFCSNGPAGEGVYPNYVECGNPLIEAFLKGVAEGMKKGKT